jgi:DNA-binding NarL/FixJ family response regulator
MQRHCLILADSHQTMLAGLRNLLASMFEVVVMVADEASLYEAVEKLTPDLVVVDLSLPLPPSQEGHVARRLKRRFPGLKLIILSIHDEPTVAQEMRAAGSEGFVLKRTAATDLIPAVREVLQGRTYFSPSVPAAGCA